MEDTIFKAYVVSQTENGYHGEIKERRVRELPGGELLVKVKYSSLNYKDFLSAIGNRGVTKNYPHTPGIDSVGEVVKSLSKKFQVGDQVIVTSYDLGMNTPGGFGQYIRVPENWALKLPQNLSMEEAMAYGTAGLTAGLSVLKLVEQVKPKEGRIAISGATGGVGSLALSMLSQMGYAVTAITGKELAVNLLFDLGAKEVMYRSEIQEENNKPLMKDRFSGGIDTIGGSVLENIIKSTQANGVVTCCGNAASANLNLTVYPFILRGVSLIGIDSQNCPMELREKVWEMLAGPYKLDNLKMLVRTVKLSELNAQLARMKNGEHIGRTIIEHEY